MTDDTNDRESVLTPDGADGLELAAPSSPEEPAAPRRSPSPRTKGGIRKILLSDLRRWPAAFQWRLREWVEHDTSDTHWALRAYAHFREARERPEGSPPPPSSCACGCQGFNGRAAEEIRRLREAIADYRASTSPRMRDARRPEVERRKTALLEILWRFDRPRIDRRALETHALEDTSTLLQRREADLQHHLDVARYYRGRLAHGRYLVNRGKTRAGMPLSGRTRDAFRAAAERVEEALPTLEAKTKRMRRLLEDRAACVRDFTDCLRGDPGVWGRVGACRALLPARVERRSGEGVRTGSIEAGSPIYAPGG